jgi:SAM-dependent methyltransferase/tetratricopeptide (TPR) repeat protein
VLVSQNLSGLGKRLTVPGPLRGIDDLAAEARRCFDFRDLPAAERLCKEVLARTQSHVDSLNLLGLMAQESARHAKAIRYFAKAIAADPDNAACHYNIGSSYEALNDRDKAAAHFREAIALGMSRAEVDNHLVMQGAAVAACLDRIKAAWPRRPSAAELFAAPSIADDVLFCCGLETIRLSGLVAERLLTEARYALLRLATEAAPSFGGIDASLLGLCSALAQQCFINEYVYAQSDEETRLIGALRDLLQAKLHAGSRIPPFLLAIIAAYYPLHALPNARTLAQMAWPSGLSGLGRQQLHEPAEEARDRSTIPALTPIADTSARVRRMYEENPYPRWTIITRDLLPKRSDAKRDAEAREGAPVEEILVAGCGTGSKAIRTALLFPNAKVLAIDMSLSSLAYARRKAREANVRNIEFAQADIMNLGAIGRRFDKIEVIGVLHHLEAPLAGWCILLSLLRPGGVMLVGLYSVSARKAINVARAFVSERGYRSTPDEIRACRQALIANDSLRRELGSIHDFFTMSDCRDMLFHVMEHQFTIAQIKTFIADQRLSFLGFDIDPENLARFQQQYPDPAALVDLDCWERFEAANPRAFIQTYLFYVQSPVTPIEDSSTAACSS